VIPSNRTNNVLRYQETESGRRTEPSRGEDRMIPHKIAPAIQAGEIQSTIMRFEQLYMKMYNCFTGFPTKENKCKQLPNGKFERENCSGTTGYKLVLY
jgi:hypothetical protein